MTPTKTATREAVTVRDIREDRAAVAYLEAEIDDLDVARWRRCGCHHCQMRVREVEERRRLVAPRMP